jgi:hypothetical protein
MAIGGLCSDECALRPLDYSHLLESQDTRRARYGGYGPCIADGACHACPIFQSASRTLTSLDDRVLVRVDRDGIPYLMNRPDCGWASVARRCTWQDLARLTGWSVGRAHRDSFGEGFWLERAAAPAP